MVFVGDISIVDGGYKPAFNLGAQPCRFQSMLQYDSFKGYLRDKTDTFARIAIYLLVKPMLCPVLDG